MRMRWLAGFLLVITSQLTGPAASTQTVADTNGGEWKSLFDGKTSVGWHSFQKQSFPVKGWVIDNGWLHCLGRDGGDILSDDEFEQFELQWEWKIAPGGNSGLKYFVLETRNAPLGHEYQMLDDNSNSDAKIAGGKHLTASFYDVVKPEVKPLTNPPGQINLSRVVVRGNHVEHWLNGLKILEYECGSDALKAAIRESKFKNTPGFGNRVKGHLLLQDHGSEVWFRDLKIRDISSTLQRSGSGGGL